MLDDSLPWKWKSLGIPLPENRKVTKFPFHVFDRYEIHIQGFVHFINRKLSIFQSSSPQTYFKNMYSNSHNTKTNKKRNTWYIGHTCSNIFCGSIIFLYCLKHFCNKSEVYGSKFWPNFRSSRNHPKSIGIWPGTLISHFGII